MHSAFEKIYFNIPISFQNIALSGYGYYLRRKRYKGDYKKYLNELRQLQWNKPAQLEIIQRKLLKNLITHARSSVKYYGDFFRDIVIDESNIFETLDKFPILDKEAIRSNPTSFVSNKYKLGNLNKGYTSGSTGTPLKVYHSDNEYQYQYAAFSLIREWNGITPADKKAIFGGRMVVPPKQTTPPYWRYNYTDNMIYFSIYHLNEYSMYHIVKKLIRYAPIEIRGYPSSLFTIADYIIETCQIGLINPRLILTDSETLLTWQRDKIEKAFSCRVTDYYGTEEFGPIAAQCPEQGNYHIFSNLVFLQLENSSEVGNLLVTSFIKYAMPFIKYKVGDTAVIGKEICSCGRGFPVIKNIEGRIDDIIILKDGRKIGRLDHIFKSVSGIKECQIIQEKYDLFILRIVKSGSYRNEDLNQIKENMYARLGKVDIKAEFLNVINRDARNKFRGVISKVDKL